MVVFRQDVCAAEIPLIIYRCVCVWETCACGLVCMQNMGADWYYMFNTIQPFHAISSFWFSEMYSLHFISCASKCFSLVGSLTSRRKWYLHSIFFISHLYAYSNCFPRWPCKIADIIVNGFSIWAAPTMWKQPWKTDRRGERAKQTKACWQQLWTSMAVSWNVAEKYMFLVEPALLVWLIYTVLQYYIFLNDIFKQTTA